MRALTNRILKTCYANVRCVVIEVSYDRNYPKAAPTTTQEQRSNHGETLPNHEPLLYNSYLPASSSNQPEFAPKPPLIALPIIVVFELLLHECQTPLLRTGAYTSNVLCGA